MSVVFIIFTIWSVKLTYDNGRIGSVVVWCACGWRSKAPLHEVGLHCFAYRV